MKNKGMTEVVVAACLSAPIHFDMAKFLMLHFCVARNGCKMVKMKNTAKV